MDIEKIAIDYLSEQSPAKRKSKKTRKAIMSKYEKLREKYVEEKKIVDEIKEQGKALQSNFEKHKAKLDSYYSEMTSLRKKIEEMDDFAKDFIEIEEDISEIESEQ
jgi:septal ring factor EnvC (AmiA/AmiB activator)